jgi:hypothetical protein
MKINSLEINDQIIKEDQFCSKTLEMDDIQVIIERKTGVIAYAPDDIVFDLTHHNLFVNWPIKQSDPIELNPSIIKSGLWQKLTEEITEYFLNNESVIEYFTQQLTD